MKINLSQLAVIDGIGAEKLDLAMNLSAECTVLDATGNDLAYIDLADGEILEIFKDKGVLSDEMYVAVETSDALTLMLIA